MTTDTLAHRLAQLAAEEQAILADTTTPRADKARRREEIAEKTAAIMALRRKANAQKVNGVSPAEQETRRIG